MENNGWERKFQSIIYHYLAQKNLNDLAEEFRQRVALTHEEIAIYVASFDPPSVHYNDAITKIEKCLADHANPDLLKSTTWMLFPLPLSMNKSSSTGCLGESNADIDNSAKNGPSLVEFVDTSHNQLICCNFSSDGEILACIDEKNNTGCLGESNADIDNSAKNGPSLVEFVDTSHNHQLICCNFSSDGEILACIDEKNNTIVFWSKNAHSFVATPRKPKSKKNPEEHLLIKDVCFASNSYYVAVYSDQIVQLWDANNPSKTGLPKFSTQHLVTSLGFNPRKEEELCYSISNDIRLWNLNKRSSERLVEGDAQQMTFQQDGYLAALMHNKIMIIDIQNRSPVYSYDTEHEIEVHTICCDRSGKYLAAVSEDRARVWSFESGGKPLHEIRSSGNKKFESCTFHPQYDETFVIGSYQSLEVWNPRVSNKTESVNAHSGKVRAVCTSSKAGLIASTNDDRCLKVWK